MSDLEKCPECIKEFESQYENAKELYRAGEYMQAAGLFEELVYKDPEHRYAPRYLQRCREKMQEQEEKELAMSSGDSLLFSQRPKPAVWKSAEAAIESEERHQYASRMNARLCPKHGK